MDSVAMFSIGGVVLTICIFSFLAFKINRLMNSTHSED